MKTIVVVPTYNEAESLPVVVSRIRAQNPAISILIVDDSSPDGTGEIADRLVGDDADVHVLHRADKAGLGSAYVAGFRWALERGFQAIGEMDADGSHLPEQLPRLCSALEYADVVIGSRWVRGGSVANWPLKRQVLSRVGNFYIRVVLGLRVRDVTAGYRMYRAEVLHAIELDNVASRGYCFQTDLTRRSHDAGFQIVEVPIDFVDREVGESKMSGSIVAETMAKVTGWGLQRVLARLRQTVNSAR